MRRVGLSLAAAIVAAGMAAEAGDRSGGVADSRPAGGHGIRFVGGPPELPRRPADRIAWPSDRVLIPVGDPRPPPHVVYGEPTLKDVAELVRLRDRYGLETVVHTGTAPVVAEAAAALRRFTNDGQAVEIFARAVLMAKAPGCKAATEHLEDAGLRGRKALVELLPELSHGYVRSDAAPGYVVDALARIGAPVIPEMVRLIDSTAGEHRQWALRVLGRIGGRAGGEAIVSVLPRLTDSRRSDKQLLDQAGDALVRIGAPVVAPLARHLHLAGPRCREPLAAARILGRIGGPEATAALVAALAIDDDLLRVVMVQTLAKMGPPAAEAVAPALEHRDARVRAAAVDVLGRAGGRRAVRSLVKAQADPDRIVRYKAVLGLGRIGGDQAVEALKVARKDDSPLVRETAAEALSRLQRPR